MQASAELICLGIVQPVLELMLGGRSRRVVLRKSWKVSSRSLDAALAHVPDKTEAARFTQQVDLQANDLMDLAHR